MFWGLLEFARQVYLRVVEPIRLERSVANRWREVLEHMEIPTTEAAGPAGAGGDWHQLVAAFGTKAFLRALTDGAELALECAPPGDAEAARGALADAGWSIEGEAVPFVARREFPAETDEMRAHWVRIAKLADATRAEDASAFHSALEAGETAEAVAEGEGSEDAPDAPLDVEPSKESAGSPFESIGDADNAPSMERPFAFALARSGDLVEVALGFDEVLERHEYEQLERRLIGNLRGKYDVDVSIVGAHEVKSKLDVAPKTRVALRVSAATKSLTVRDIEEAVTNYFETLSELAGVGIDPLVFLGARASRRKSGAFEAIGHSSDDNGKGAEPTRDAAPPHESVLLVADDEDEDNVAVQGGDDEVVFGVDDALEPDAPLEPGRYDDPRLRRPDATTALVDIVLRHPGYSDRNMGQVMSILLSLDYASCLEIAERAPTIVAWGVSRERGLTMKTVFEGAGGKVLLVEPGTFHED